MEDRRAELLYGGFDALFDYFESAIGSKRVLQVDLYLWSIVHVLLSSAN